MSLTCAVVQLTATADKARNLDNAERLIRAAHAGSRAHLIALPEVFNWRGRPADERGAAEPLDGPTVTRFAAVARELKSHVLLGSLLESTQEEARPFNTSVLLGPDGHLIARYRKIHLFDVHVEGHGAVRESATRAPGDRIVVAPVLEAKLGLSVCYDLRFPELYRAQSAAGAHVLTVPAAFTARTGRDHWIALLRARAIENLSYVVAANQWGTGGDSIETYGRSCIIDPWGTVLATCADGEGWTAAEIDLAEQARIRSRFPSLTHRRPDACSRPVES
jgi:predicted amidohydrolase